jgi:hypothetical protein
LRTFWQERSRGRVEASNAPPDRHKILKSRLLPLSKAGWRWYIPLAPNGIRQGLPSQEASGQVQSAPSGVDQIRFGTGFRQGVQRFIAGWSSPVARQAHNLKVTGSNPVPATKFVKNPSNLKGLLGFSFGAGSDSNNINDLGRRFKSPCNQTPTHPSSAQQFI